MVVNPPFARTPTPPAPVDARAAALAAACRPGLTSGERLRVGIDTVEVAGIEASIDAFGDRFEQRLFTDHELEAAGRVPARRAERLAARFAAKEALIKALSLAEAGVGWRDIEVCSAADGTPSVRLHGLAAAHADAAGVAELAISLSHDGGQACAVVVALCHPPGAGRPRGKLGDDSLPGTPLATAAPSHHADALTTT